MDISNLKVLPRPNRVICLAITLEVYQIMINESSLFRGYLDQQIEQFFELFPSQILSGYRMKDMYLSKKLGITIRRIEINGISYTLRPSFLMPYMTGFVKDIEEVLFLRKFEVPFWALSHVFGKDAMYWYRIEQTIGRNSLVGTTIQDVEKLPQDLSADEKHTWLLGQKAYVAMTVGDDCILGASVASNVDEKALTEAYKTFREEAQLIEPEYCPQSVNTDGWQATQSAWKTLFPSISLILCFLHVFIKIRDRAKKKFKQLFEETADKLWECYQAPHKCSFSQRIRRLHEWAEKSDLPEVIFKPLDQLRQNIAQFKKAYDLPGAHRTSNMVDRLMQRMDRHLFSTQYFHGNLSSAELSIRGWALLYNFAPSNPNTVKHHHGAQSPAERINQFRYHDSWLQNLLISASLGGYRGPPLNPL